MSDMNPAEMPGRLEGVPLSELLDEIRRRFPVTLSVWTQEDAISTIRGSEGEDLGGMSDEQGEKASLQLLAYANRPLSDALAERGNSVLDDVWWDRKDEILAEVGFSPTATPGM